MGKKNQGRDLYGERINKQELKVCIYTHAHIYIQKQYKSVGGVYIDIWGYCS